MEESHRNGLDATKGQESAEDLALSGHSDFVLALKETLAPFKWHSKYSKTILITVTVLCLCISVFIRVNQYSRWKDSERYSYSGKPIMTTADAYYWIRFAREYTNGQYMPGGIETVRNFPEGAALKPDPIPALSFLLARLSPLFGGDIYKTGIFIIPLLSSLFMIPLIIYFYRMGFPAIGIMCVLISTASPIYFMRTSIGRVDTDSLNLLFPFLCSLLIYLASKSDRLRNSILYSLLCGMSMYLFIWWYDHRGFLLVFAAIFLVSLVLFRKPMVTIVLSLIVYFIFASPYNLVKSVGNLTETFRSFSDVYLSRHQFKPLTPGRFKHEAPSFAERKEKPSTGIIQKPNIYNTIDERVKLPFSEVLASLVGSRTLAILGFIFFAVFAIFKMKELVPLLPILSLGFLSFTSGNRFAMYLTPFIGIGFGMFITATVNLSLSEDNISDKHRIIKALLIYGFPFILFLALFIKIPLSIPLEPVFDTKTHAAINNLKGHLKKDSSIFSWWDEGFAIEDLSGYKTIADGGAQNTSKIYLYARGLVSPKQSVLYKIVALIEKFGNGIETVGEKDIFFNDQYKVSIRNDNNYLLFTSNMIKVFSGIYYIGTWTEKTDTGKIAGYDDSMKCSEIINDVLQCDGGSIDLSNGQFNGVIVLKKSSIIKNGVVKSERDYFPTVFGNNNLYMEVVIDENDKILNTYLIDRDAYESNFNQMFFLGRYDHSLFEEKYNEFPYARTFIVKKVDIVKNVKESKLRHRKHPK
ncbi:MAG: hypothetical protein HQK89_13015 [Nitrospirae bacterium]|nr:hypothetical protein [Nitrospirota bacterium]